MKRVDWDRLDDHVRVEHGSFDPDRLTLFSIFKNEIFFCKAFFDHYRRLGVEQFLILDDGSTDGTREFLCGQNDCVLLSSALGFEDPVEYFPTSGVQRSTRAAIFLKAAIPQFFLRDKYSIYADADEFLILPPGMRDLFDVLEVLRREQVGAVVSSLIDFYPRNISETVSEKPDSSHRMFRMFPYFDCRRLVRLSFRGKPVPVYPSKLRDLAVEYGLRVESRLRKRILQRILNRALANAMSYKTPIVLHTPERYYMSSHRVRGRVGQNKILSMSHFVFTPNSLHKAERIVAGGERRSMKYEALLGILEGNQKGEIPFIGVRSKRFETPQQLIECGLMRWDVN